MHKKAISRLIILVGCILGTLALPKPASADDCFQQCNPAYQDCLASGAFGCQEVYFDCLCSCRGTC